MKEQKYHLYLSKDEYSEVLQSLIRLKNSLIAQGRYTDGVDDILCKVISEQVVEAFEGRIRIFESRIPSTVKVGESIYYCEPLLEYAPQTKVSKAYLDFGKELMGYEG